MYLRRLELSGFKSFARKTSFEFSAPITAVVGPNGSGKSNIAEAFRFVLGEQSMKSLRGKRGEDLIFNGSRVIGRLNKASVMITLDNSGKVFPVDYDEVVIGREVYRDGTNEYTVNGSRVRLKDVIEFLAAAKVGSSGHHIISQGRADHFLLASARERRAMIEDALGLRIYHFKRLESERKLTKTEENLQKVRSLRKEIEPHLKFLKKQVEKIEQARVLRQELIVHAKEYFKREEGFISHEKEKYSRDADGLREQMHELDREIDEIKGLLAQEQETEGNEKSGMIALEEEMRSARERKDAVARSLGRVEGMIELEKRRIREAEWKQHHEPGSVPVPYTTVEHFVRSLENDLESIATLQDISMVEDRLLRLRQEVRVFLEDISPKKEDPQETEEKDDMNELARMEDEKIRFEHELADIAEKEHQTRASLEAIRQELDRERGAFREAEKTLFEALSRKNALGARLGEVETRLSLLERDQKEFEHTLAEMAFAVGREVLAYPDVALSEEQALSISREEMREHKRKIEKMRYRLEEAGGTGEEVIEEYEQLQERDQFLEREIADLEQSAESLQKLIRDLTDRLDREFKDGLQKINEQFQAFFSLLFDGGKASLSVVMEPSRKRRGEDVEDMLEDDAFENDDGPAEEGVDISISLPQKRLRGIQMLSGGERSLTSVALLFAVSQVNPPPFLVLDETDAALDEANSRRYGDMLEVLAKKSQLIVITHNRETMSRAGILYGVTVGADAVSKVLSVKFEDAAEQAAR